MRQAPETPTLFTFNDPPDPKVAACPVGETMRTSRGRWGLATATYSKDETYRYRLSRIWDETNRRACWIMLNPSTATEEQTDPTVERTLRYARAWGYGQSEVVNIFALRSTDPRGLYETPNPIGEDPEGADNNQAILRAAQDADLIIAAWGVHGEHRDRGGEVRRLLADAGVKLHYLRLTKDGHPGHPLYLPANAEPQEWAYA